MGLVVIEASLWLIWKGFYCVIVNDKLHCSFHHKKLADRNFGKFAVTC